jgi:hypothetical protein
MNKKIEILLHEGFSISTLETFTSEQINVLYERVKKSEKKETKEATTKTTTSTTYTPDEMKKGVQGGKMVIQNPDGTTTVTKEGEVTERAKSKKQQQFFGIVRGMQKGDIPKKGKAGEKADEMKIKDVKDFASTKHKGLPKKKKTETKENVKNIEESIMKLIEGHIHPTTTKIELLNSIKKFKR